MKKELSHKHHGVKFYYYHFLYKGGGKIFIPRVLRDMNIHTSSKYNKVKETHYIHENYCDIEKHCKVVM